MTQEEALRAAFKKVAIGLVKQKINKSLEYEVAPIVKKKLKDYASEEIYIKYPNRFSGGYSRTREFLALNNYVAKIDKNQMMLRVYNATPAHSIFGTEITSDYEGILGYWIETGKVPVLWDNGNSDYKKLDKPVVIHYRNGTTRTITRAFPERPYAKETRKYYRSKAGKKKLKEALLKGMKKNI